MNQAEIRQELLSAINLKDIDKFKELFDQISDIDAILDSHSFTPTRCCTTIKITGLCNRFDMFKICVNKGCSIDDVLKYLLTNGNTKYIQFLLDNKNIKINDIIKDLKFVHSDDLIQYPHGGYFEDRYRSLLEYTFDNLSLQLYFRAEKHVNLIKLLIDYGAEIKDNMKSSFIIKYCMQEKIIKEQENKIKELEEETIELKYRPPYVGGPGYLQTKEHFYTLSNNQKKSMNVK